MSWDGEFGATPDWVRMMARYNAWQNIQMAEAIATLPEAEVERDRGAFFGSIRKTVSHLLWADEIWLSRLVGKPRDGGGVDASVDWAPDIVDWVTRRPQVDAALTAWAADLDSCAGDLVWISPLLGGEARRPFAQIVAHVFNHQTHHRGQVHAMLTAAGAATAPTDILFMPNPEAR